MLCRLPFPSTNMMGTPARPAVPIKSRIEFDFAYNHVNSSIFSLFLTNYKKKKKIFFFLYYFFFFFLQQKKKKKKKKKKKTQITPNVKHFFIIK
jgi:hypothetical protein